MRYLFRISFSWIAELEWHMFALIFLLGAAYTLKEDAHVRVDLFYDRWSEHTKAWVNLAGVLVFLLPWCLIVIRASYRYFAFSFRVGERSPDPGGLPALYVLKFAIVAAFVLLALQAVAMALRCVAVLMGQRSHIFSKSDGS